MHFERRTGTHSEELFRYALVEQTHHRRLKFACNLSGGILSDPTISPIARSTMITTSNSLDREQDAQIKLHPWEGLFLQ